VIFDEEKNKKWWFHGDLTMVTMVVLLWDLASGYD